MPASKKTKTDFTTTLLVEESPAQVFQAINKVSEWWSQNLKGIADKPGEVFEVRFADVQFFKLQLTEFVRYQKIVWDVIDSYQVFLKDKEEWTGTRICFELSAQENKTLLTLTHKGISEVMECYTDTSTGWVYYLQLSLLALLETGKGNPNVV